jgi:hypothetical protein
MRARTSASSFGLPGVFGFDRRRQNKLKASAMPGDHGFRFDDNQDVAPRRPKATEQSPEYSILDSQPRVRPLSLEHTQLLTEGKNLKGEVVARTEESAEAAEDEKWNHGTGFIA